jgi:hypothetical protein
MYLLIIKTAAGVVPLEVDAQGPVAYVSHGSRPMISVVTSIGGT